MRQEVLNDGNTIFHSILEELTNAKEEILVTQTWFTDNILLEKLIEKAKENVTVKVIVSNKKDNHKLDFNTLSKIPSATVKKRKGKSYDGINSKYCIIDKSIAISGSYNWSSNAKTNAEENVIITEHLPTVKKLHNQFYKTLNHKPSIVNRLFNWLKKEKQKKEYKLEQEITRKINPEEKPIEQNILKVDEVLDSIVIAEIKSFDRKELENQGFESAEKVGGDPSVLYRIMDSLYHLFISNRDNLIEKKLNLKSKIDLFVEEYIRNFSELYRGEILEKEKEQLAKEKQYTSDIIDLDTEIIKFESKINLLKTQQIPEKEKEIKELEELKSEMDREYILPPEKKWYHIIPFVILPVGLLVVIFLFYSSSAYILLYAMEDYELSEIPTKIFNAKAYSLANDKGGTALIYIIFFTIIPFALSIITKYIKNKNLKIFSWLAIIVLDTLIAFQIKEITGEIYFLETGIVNVINLKWVLEFVIIFFLGFIPLWVFVIALERFKNYISNQILSKEEEEAKIKKTQLTNQILFLDEELYAFEEERNALNNLIIEKVHQKKQINHNLLFLPSEYEKIVNNIKVEREEKFQYVKARADIYRNGIDNNTIFTPMPALKDRVNVFLQGWDNWLHDQMSAKRASEFSIAGKEITNNWIDHNMPQLKSNDIKVITLK